MPRGYALNGEKMIPPIHVGCNHPAWKGKDVGYFSLHAWIKRELGEPQHCEHCEKTNKKKYEWANKDHKYTRIVEDWIRLCTSCHRLYDAQFLEIHTSSCKLCEKMFEHKNAKKKFCSIGCKYLFWNNKRKKL